MNKEDFDEAISLLHEGAAILYRSRYSEAARAIYEMIEEIENDFEENNQ
jgi:hypothetical protein